MSANQKNLPMLHGRASSLGVGWWVGRFLPNINSFPTYVEVELGCYNFRGCGCWIKKKLSSQVLHFATKNCLTCKYCFKDNNHNNYSLNVEADIVKFQTWYCILVMDTDSFDDNKIYTHQRNHRNEINIPIYISNKTKR